MNAAESDRPEDRARIRRQQRRLILPLILALVVGGAWWWSYRSLERYLLAGYGGQVNEIVLLHGGFMAGVSGETIGSHDAFTVRRLAETLNPSGNLFFAGGPLDYGGQFAILRGDFAANDSHQVPLGLDMVREPNGKFVSASVLFPIWFFLVPIGLWLLLVALKIWRVRRAAAEGCCLHCGYDLRASADRCPECGAAIAERSVAAIRSAQGKNAARPAGE